MGERNYPSSDGFDPHSQTDFGPHSVLLDFTDEIENPRVAFLGEKLAQECGSGQDIEYLSDVPSRSLLSRITDHYLQIIANQAPIGFEAEFVNQRGATILYRGILLPFSSNNDTIDYIYGVINWKELADQQTADELLLQIDQVLKTNSRPSTDDLPMTEWADGPVEHGAILDLDEALEVDTPFPEPDLSGSLAPAHLPHVADLRHAGPSDAGLGHGNVYAPVTKDAERSAKLSLADWLAAAREYAEEAANSEMRTHSALYAAIGTAYDFALTAQQFPDDYRELLSDSGLTVQDRAPMTPVVKLVFGLAYDKTRLAEYTASLDHAHRLELERGNLANLLNQTPGGLKALVAEERRLRKLASGRPESDSRDEKLAHKLRALPGYGIDEISTSGAEFTLLVARRSPGGPLEILGEVDDEPALVIKAARRLVG